MQVETGLMPRSWHVAQAQYDCHASSSECRVFVFGGNVHYKGLTGARLDTADLRVLSFGELLGVQVHVCFLMCRGGGVCESSRVL